MRFAPGPLLLVCVTAPCRWMTPEESLYQAGAREPKPALPEKFAVFTGIGWMVTAAGAVAASAEPAPGSPSAAKPRAIVMVPSPAASRRIERVVRDLVRFSRFMGSASRSSAQHWRPSACGRPGGLGVLGRGTQPRPPGFSARG